MRLMGRGGVTGPLLALALLPPCAAAAAQVGSGMIKGASVQQLQSFSCDRVPVGGRTPRDRPLSHGSDFST